MLFVFMAMIDNPDDQQRFEMIYTAYRDMMYHYAYRILQDNPSAEDAVHDAFLSYARNYDRYQGMDNPQTRNFLMITVRNAAFKIFNRRKRETAVEEIYQEDDVIPDLSEETEKKDTKRILFEMIQSLDSKYGDVIMLKYYCNLSVQEIAESLDLTPDNVKVRLHRARTLLKSKLEGVGIVE